MLVRLRFLALYQISNSNNLQSSLILGIIAFFIPPFPVAVRRGCGPDLLLNVLLTFLCWLPGVAHAFYVIVRYSGKDKRRHDRRYSSTFRDSAYRRNSNNGRSRSPSRPQSRSRSCDRHVYPRYDRREYIEPPQMGAYHDARYYSSPPTMPPERPMYAYSR
jgi:uncharacterized membrane protein YqaE (UPF0057 family)